MAILVHRRFADAPEIPDETVYINTAGQRTTYDKLGDAWFEDKYTRLLKNDWIKAHGWFPEE